MKPAPFNPTRLSDMIAALESLRQHRVQNPINQSDVLYYETLCKYYSDIRDARADGKNLVYHSIVMPTELLYAMDIVPGLLEPVCGALASIFPDLYDEASSSAKAYGLAPEVCSMHRLMIGNALNGVMPPPDACLWSNMTCDNTAKSSELLADLWQCGGYYLDRGYKDNARELAYFTRELQDMVEFLEWVTGRKMDYDHLSEVVARGREMMILQREVEDLRKNRPMPIRSRAGMLSHLLSAYCTGSHEAVTFFRQLRDEAKATAERGQGAAKEERYRLLMFFEPPVYGLKIIDWMERAHGAVLVFEPAFALWGAGDYDPGNPMEALAKKTFMRPGVRQQHGPVEGLVEDMVRSAKEYDVDGVLSFSHVGCRQSCSCNRLLKDKLREEADLPFFVVEHDFVDQAFAPPEEMRDKIEGFLEMIDERRGA